VDTGACGYLIVGRSRGDPTKPVTSKDFAIARCRRRASARDDREPRTSLPTHLALAAAPSLDRRMGIDRPLPTASRAVYSCDDHGTPIDPLESAWSRAHHQPATRTPHCIHGVLRTTTVT
jgi:hypothetical protein